MKNWIIILGTIVLFIALLMGGCRALIYTIGNSNTCARFNIDNIELRTGLDIPATTSVNCIYKDGIKSATFYLDTSKVDIGEYLSKNKFRQEGVFYTHVGDKKRTSWMVEYHPTLAELRMRIVYKDVIENN